MFELDLESRNFHHLLLTIDPIDQQEAWEASQAQSNTLARYNAYVNRVCLKTFLKWFTGWISEESLSQPAIWPAEESLTNLLEFVNGTAITLGETKIVIIPTENHDFEELIVPQEWVDIPEWVADYYLAAQVNLEAEEEDCTIQICGFSTHQQLKNEAFYHANEKTYIVPVENLIGSLTTLQLTIGLNWKEKVAELTKLSENETKKFLQQLGNAKIYSPRLQRDITFEQWAALISDEECRQQLYQQRMGIETKKPVINLSHWFHNIVDAGWQTIDEVIEILGTQQENLTYGFRSGDTYRDLSSTENLAVSSLIELLKTKKDRATQCRVVDLLSHLAPGNPDAISAITALLNQTQDQEVRRQAAVSLGRIDPTHPQAGTRRAKIINLGVQLNHNPVILVITLIPIDGNRKEVHLRVFPESDQSYLPPNLELTILSEGEIVDRIKSAAKDNAIQYAFKSDPGDCFSVQLTLSDVNVIENFVV
jgi:hypothetical protein